MALPLSQKLTLLSGTLLTVLFGGLAIWWQRRKEKEHIPSKWRQIGAVRDIMIYPLKSGRAVALAEANCSERGLEVVKQGENLQLRDRSFVVFNELSGEFVSGKQLPKLILINVKTINGNNVVFTTAEDAQLCVAIPDISNKHYTFKMWFGEKLETVDCGDEAAKWFSEMLIGKPSGLRLGYYVPGLSQRNLYPSWQSTLDVYPALNNKAAGTYADLAAYTVVNAASLDDLNARLASSESQPPVSIANFRPNLVVEGMAPFVEDSWTWLKIGESIVLRRVKPCTRCIFVNIDPNSAERNQAMEPLKTLKKYRLTTDPTERQLEKESPIMGVHMGLHVTGHIKVGDLVFIQQ